MISNILGGLELKSSKKPEMPMIRVNSSHTSKTTIVTMLFLLVSSNGRLSFRPAACTAIIIKNAIPKTNAIKRAEMCKGMYGMFNFC
jgi:hypothetical protein